MLVFVRRLGMEGEGVGGVHFNSCRVGWRGCLNIKLYSSLLKNIMCPFIGGKYLFIIMYFGGVCVGEWMIE